MARAIDDLEDLVTATRQITAQTRRRLAGQIPDGATRRVSLHDPDARPIAEGRLGKLVEFGHKAQLVEGDDGVIVDHNVERGNPADAPHLAPAVDRVRTRAGRPPRTVTADRGYGEKAIEDDLRDLGVRNVVIPPMGKPRLAGEPRNTDQRSDEQSSGAPESKAESAPSNVDTAGTAPASTAPQAPRYGSAAGPGAPTWSRSAPWQRERRRSRESVANQSRPAASGRIMHTEAPRFWRSK
ncbi:Mobile element protein (plasmid) [Rhodococcus sp. WAY2]|nr:Mobile element protein [Rhodococcus sp. WAY2]